MFRKLKLFSILFFILTSLFFINIQVSYAQIFSSNHHLSNWDQGDAHNLAEANHALQMGYFYIAKRKPLDPRFSGLRLIKLHNARIIPFEIHVNRTTGVLNILYLHYLERNQDNLNPLALANGLNRENDRRYPISATDLEIIKGYAGARSSVDDLTLSNLSVSNIESRFHVVFEYTSGDWRVLRLVGNWRSRKVVQDMINASTRNLPWQRYDAYFFDSFAERRDYSLVNGNYVGLGSYATWQDGQVEMVKQIIDYAKNPLLIGKSAYATFANVWDPKENDRVQRLYGTNTIRFDHYYFERGGVGTQNPNGVIPSTSIPAYVAVNRSYYIPASRVALDDVYGYYRQASFSRAEHFRQHLDAAGTAGLYGGWFGWYGEDSVTMRDSTGRLIFTNDLQLLRALPNWDNLGQVPVPPYNQEIQNPERSWNGTTYQSSRSYASSDVIYSRNPFNNELFAVFRNLSGVIQLRPGEEVLTAYFVDDWFAKTAESALSALTISNYQIRLRASYSNRLLRGIRITLSSSAFTPTPTSPGQASPTLIPPPGSSPTTPGGQLPTPTPVRGTYNFPLAQLFDFSPRLSDLESVFENVVRGVLGFTLIILFIMIIIGGYKYLTSGGDPKSLESAKATLTYAIAGVLLISLSYLILILIQETTGTNITNFRLVVP